MPLDDTYDPRRIETRWYEYWERGGHFAPANPAAAPFCIMIPPPNVTGNLHMGHAFQDLIMDALTRYHRMRGRHTLWQPGTDHAGIATQMVVERAINARGQTRHDYGRDKFIDEVWRWKAESGDNISRQLRRLGASADWENERFTMDDGLSAAVTRVFVQLFDEGLIYRGKRLVNWDPVLHTALSDLEVLATEERGEIWYLRYPLAGDDGGGDGDGGGVVVATTRPETILGDSAVAVHPDDERYRALIGKQVELPLTGRRIPVIADEYVDPAFGSGCVKITPAHDFNDYQVWLRHRDTAAMRGQPHGGLINIFTADAAIRENQNAADAATAAEAEGELLPAAYIGLDRYAARQRILADLTARGLVAKSHAHKLMIPRGDRSGAVVEPLLTDQWYVDLTRDTLPDGRPGGKTSIAEPAIDMVRSGRVRFVPPNWDKTYYQWLDNLEDWCISRQIWWGHRIPAWYDADGSVYVAADEDAVRAKYELPADAELRRDEDVLDTWFSSALWPFSTLGWPQQTDRLTAFYPTSVLVTGFDIIFFWVARMIMMGGKFMGEVPFHEVYIHGLVRDAHGNKMSKSKGNVLDPIDLIDGIDLETLVQKRISGLLRSQDAEQIERQTRQDFPAGIPRFGADALRFTFAALASTGRDINFDLARTEGYRNFCNKIWNAARFVLLHTEGKLAAGATDDAQPTPTTPHHSLADLWMLSTLQRSTAAINQAIQTYRLDHAAAEIYTLIWNHYCDWYLELSKPLLNDPTTPAAKLHATRQTLRHTLDTILRLTHPIMPFITEEIWQTIAPAATANATIMNQPYPQPDDNHINPPAEQQMQQVMHLVLGIRKLRTEHNIPPSARVTVSLSPPAQHPTYIQALAKTHPLTDAQIDGLTLVTANTEITLSTTTTANATTDRQTEITRTTKEIKKTETLISQKQTKLTTPAFLTKAPPEVIAKEKARLKDLTAHHTKLTAQLEKLRS